MTQLRLMSCTFYFKLEGCPKIEISDKHFQHQIPQNPIHRSRLRPSLLSAIENLCDENPKMILWLNDRFSTRFQRLSLTQLWLNQQLAIDISKLKYRRHLGFLFVRYLAILNTWISKYGTRLVKNGIFISTFQPEKSIHDD